MVAVSKQNNTVELYDEVYNLNELKEEKDLLSPNLINIQDGKEVENKRLYTYWSGFINGKHVFIMKDENGDIEFLSIMNDFHVNSFTKHSSSGEASFLSKLESDDEDMVDLSNDYVTTDDTESYPLNMTRHAYLPSNISSFYEDTSIFSYYSRCTYYRRIDVAIAYDSSFCSLYGGHNKAAKKVLNIVSLASNRYRQQGLCLKLRVSALEGHCDVNTDPYVQMRHQQSGCAGYDALLQVNFVYTFSDFSSHIFPKDFTSYWHYNRKQIPRDAAHLFVGKQFQDAKIGCAGIGTLCRGAYAVESMSSKDINFQSLLFAHELGHNCGAYHTSDPSTIMYPFIADGSDGFSAGTTSAMLNYLNHQKCLKKVAS